MVRAGIDLYYFRGCEWHFCTFFVHRRRGVCVCVYRLSDWQFHGFIYIYIYGGDRVGVCHWWWSGGMRVVRCTIFWYRCDSFAITWYWYQCDRYNVFVMCAIQKVPKTGAKWTVDCGPVHGSISKAASVIYEEYFP